jgi:hypothetical protein
VTKAQRHRALRIALLAPCYWPEIRWGMERFARDLADRLMDRGHSPRLITSHPGRPTRSIEDGLEVIRHWRPPEGQLLRRDYDDHLTHAPLSYLTLRAGRHDLAHALFHVDGMLAARWTHVTGKPSVFSYMGIPDRAWISGRRMRLKATYEAATVAARSWRSARQRPRPSATRWG